MVMHQLLSTPPSTTLKKAWNNIPKNIRITFFVVFGLGMLVHLYMMMGVYLNHDGLAKFMVSFNGLNTGRWVQKTAVRIGGFNTVPVVRGTLAVFYISVSTCLIVYCLGIRRLFYSLLVGACMVTFPATATSFMYIYTTDAIHVATLLSIIGVFFCWRFQKFGFIAGGVVFGLTLGMYQCYICYSAALLVLLLILDILRSNDTIKVLIIRAAKYLGALAIGFIIYFPVLRLAFMLNPGHELTTNKQMDQLGVITLAEVPGRIADAYRELYLFFAEHPFFPDFVGKYTYYLPLIFFIMAAIMLAGLAYLAISRKVYRNIPRLVLFLVLVAVWPMAVNANYLMVQDAAFVYILMQYPLVMVYIFAITLLDEAEPSLPAIKQKLAKYGTVLASWGQILIIVFVCYSYFIGINEAYVKAGLVIDQTTHYSEKLLQRVEEFPGYSPGMPVRTIGEPKLDDTLPYLNKNDAYGYTVKNNLIYADGYPRFFQIYFGTEFDILRVTDDEWLITNADTIENMALYPQEGSMEIIDNVLYIRLGEKG